MKLSINGHLTSIRDERTLLLWVLRDELGMTGTKFGCGAGICGACTVHADGEPIRACLTTAAAVAGKGITTIEGLSQGAELHPVQQAFIEQQVPQCGWCMSGQMMTAAALLEQNPDPTPADIDAAMNRNYCRCGCYARIRTAIVRSAELAAGARAEELPV